MFARITFVLLAVLLTAAAGPATAKEAGRYSALVERAGELARAGRYRESIPYLRKLVELRPYDERALYHLALALLHQEAPVSRESYGEAARLLQECEAMQEQVQDFGPALGLRRFYLGLALWRSGRSEPALAAFERSFAADPDGRSDAVYNMFAIHDELGHVSRARILLERYKGLRP